MTAASSWHSSVDVTTEDNKRGSIRKGSIFNLWNLALNERLNETTDVDIQLFDGRKMRALIDHRINGKTLLNHIATELGDASKSKYLGLIIEPPGEVPEWMDLYSSIAKEKAAKGSKVLMVRIKFYPADPVLEMNPDCFAHLLYFQLRHDLAVGRLLGKERDRCLMVAYSIICEDGLKGISKDQLMDYAVVRSTISSHYLDKSVQNQIKEYLEENYEMSREEALNFFLRIATKMDTYGIEPFDAKDQRGNGIAVGFNFRGLSVFKSSQQVNFFRWESMINYECERKNVVITIKTHDIKKKIGFKCDTRANAMQLFRRLREASRFFAPEHVEDRSDMDKRSKFASSSFTKSTESVNSESSYPVINQTCQITHVKSSVRPSRYFSITFARDSAKSSINLIPPPFDEKPKASIFVNQSVQVLSSHYKSPVVLLHVPEVDDGSKTPTPSPYDSSATELTDATVVQDSVTPTNMKPPKVEWRDVCGKPTSQYDSVNWEEEGEKPNLEVAVDLNKSEQLKVVKAEKKFGSIHEEETVPAEKDTEEKDPVVTIVIEKPTDDGDEGKAGKGSLSELGSSLDYTSQESLSRYKSPFGDFASTNLFKERNQNSLGLLDFEMSASTSSITIPTVGKTVPQSTSPVTHFFPRRRSKNS